MKEKSGEEYEAADPATETRPFLLFSGRLAHGSSSSADDQDLESLSVSQLPAGDMSFPPTVACAMASPATASGAMASLSTAAGAMASSATASGDAAQETLPLKKRGRYSTDLMESWLKDQMETFSTSEQLTSQASQSHSHMHCEVEYSTSMFTIPTASLAQPTRSVPAPLNQMASVTLDNRTTTLGPVDGSSSCTSSFFFNIPSDDGFKWRRLKETVLNYYRCSIRKCQALKKVEFTVEGEEERTIYGSQHNHPPPPPKRHAKESATLHVGYNKKGDLNLPLKSETGSKGYPERSNLSAYSTDVGAPCREFQESGQGIQE